MRTSATLCLLVASACTEVDVGEPVTTEFAGWSVSSTIEEGDVQTVVWADDGELMATSEYAPGANRWTLSTHGQEPLRINDPRRKLEPVDEDMLPTFNQTLMAAILAGAGEPAAKNRNDCYDKQACLWINNGWQCTSDCTPIGQCNDGPHIGKMCDYCSTHDVCYIENNCNASLWSWLGISGSDACHNCDNGAIFDAVTQGCKGDEDPYPELD